MTEEHETASGPRGAWRWWPLRFVAFVVILIALYAGSQFGAFVFPAKQTLLPPLTFALIAAAVGALVLIIAYRLLVRWTEHRTAGELGAARALPQFIAGALIGLILFASVYAILWAYGAVKFNGWHISDALAMEAVAALLAGIGEELIFRGGVFRLFEEGFGTLVALILSGALFGLIHAGNKGATPESTAAIALEAGILLAAAYLLARSLWLPIGLHFGWNFTEGGIFGAAVSGGQSHGLVNATLSGPRLITGGAFGPEASIPAVSVCLVAAIVMLVLAIRRGQWRRFTFSLRA